MTQNTSSAVMQQRKEPHNSLEDYPTPPWATRALCEWLDKMGLIDGCVREPAANRGHMVHPLSEYFDTVQASDIHDYGYGYPQHDYLFGPLPSTVDWTITNPPFRLAQQFIERAIKTSRIGCAVIVRSAFMEGIGRYNELFSQTPPSHILQFVERVVIHKKKLTATGSTATAYSWVIWTAEQRFSGTDFGWIPPCRKRLEKPSDYDLADAPDASPSNQHNLINEVGI